MARIALVVTVAGAMIMWGAAAASAKECKGANFPDQVQVAGSALALNGLGLRQATVFKVNVYVAGLYVTQTSADANTILEAKSPKQLSLHFLRDVGSGDLNKAWDEGFAINAKDQLPALQERIAKLKSWIVDMKKDQRLSFTYTPAAGTEVAVDRAAKGTIAGDDFAKALLSIWLGPKPPNPGLKTGLLGGACS